MRPSTQNPWGTFRADLAHTAVLTDFDGTLSEVMVDPAVARPIAGVVQTLEALAPKAHTVAVVSGRPLAFLQTNFGPSVTLSGLYGLETRRNGTVQRHPEVEAWRTVIAATVEAGRDELPADVRVEAKGLALTLHYRAAPHRQATIEQWASRRASATGLVMEESRCSVELNPPIEVDKGTVIEGFASAPGVRHACYLGDDRADLAAFAALDKLRAGGLDTHTVAVRGAETPPEVLEAADVIVEGPGEAVALLASLITDGP